MFSKHSLAICALVLAGAGASFSTAEIITPDPADLSDLDHGHAYLWGFELALAPGESVAAATLTFHNIRNWDEQPNILYCHQLDGIDLGVTVVSDGGNGGDYFETTYAGTQAPLVTYENLTTTPVELVYEFTSADLVTLNTHLADGQAGLGFDPDCHFYNDGIELSLEIVPEPASCALLLLGGLTLSLRRR